LSKQLIIDNEIIDRARYTKFHGVVVDKYLSFDVHVNISKIKLPVAPAFCTKQVKF